MGAVPNLKLKPNRAKSQTLTIRTLVEHLCLKSPYATFAPPREPILNPARTCAAEALKPSRPLNPHPKPQKNQQKTLKPQS